MSPTAARAAGVSLSSAAFVAGGMAAGGWWWPVAVGGVAATLAGLSGRRAGLVQAVATVALAAGVVAADRDAVVLALAAGVVGSLELAAAADRVNRVRTQVAWPSAGRLAAALAPAPLVLWVGNLAVGPSVPLTLLAAAAAAALVLRAIGNLVRTSRQV